MEIIHVVQPCVLQMEQLHTDYITHGFTRSDNTRAEALIER